MKHPDSVYYTEGVSGQRKFTFEVFREKDGSYRAIAARWNARTNKVVEQTQFTAADKAGLREQPYPATRQVKIFLNSGFWDDSNV